MGADKLPLFSALGSLYHAESPDFLDQALASLHEQTIKADEIVLVLDGPIGAALESVIKKWHNLLPIKLVKLSVNKGLGEALNKGLEACSHNWVARFDTDDINRINRFEVQLNSAVRTNADLLSASIEEFDKVPGDLGRFRVAEAKQDICKALAKRNYVNHMAVMFKKDIVLKAGGYKHLHFMEDYYLWLRMRSQNAKFEFMPEVLVDARVGNGMEARRSGVSYVKSEFKLAKIKYRLGFSGAIYSSSLFAVRASTRLVPVPVLKQIYKVLLRK